MARIVLLGAGVIGLGTAMLLADDGHDVTVLERDAAAPAANEEDAWFEWERRGVNQFRLPHFFLARYHKIIKTELPRVVGALDAAGALRINTLLDTPETIRGPVRPGDEEFELLTGRRPVVEMAVGRVAVETPRLEVRRGVTVEGLLTGTAPSADGTHVVGVRTSDGDVPADLVVDMMGRRSALPRLLEEVGSRPPLEELEDDGMMYFGRHFKSKDGSLPALFGPPLQRVGTLTSLTLPADNGTWGVALVTSVKDKALLGLRDVDRWDAVLRSLPLVAHWLDGEPLDERVTTMSKIEDRLRTYVVDGAPVATGVVSVGDAWACSNPMHGRGASIGMLQGLALRDQLRATGLGDPTEFALAFHAATEAEAQPWFDWTRAQDRHRRRMLDTLMAGEPYRPADERFELESALEHAVAKDPDLLRLFLRGVFVLDPLDTALADAGTAERILELGGAWRDEPGPGPSRDELVALVAG